MKHLGLVVLVLLFAVRLLFGGESMRWVDGMFPTYGDESANPEDCPPGFDSICVVVSGIDYGGNFSSPLNYPNAKHITNVMVGSYYSPVVIWEIGASWGRQSFFTYWDDMFKFWSYPDSFTSNQGQDTGRGNVCADSHGNLHFAWHQAGNPDGYEVFYTRAILDTSTGVIQYYVEPPKMISDTNGQEEHSPVLAIHNDNPFAVWNMGSIGSESAIMYNYSTDNGVTWVGEDTAFAGTMPGSWNLPCIAPDPNSEDKWVSLAFDYTGDGSMDVFALHYYASGDTWSGELAAVAPIMHAYCLPAIVVDYSSIPHIVFQENLTKTGGMSGLAGWNQCGPAGSLYYIHRQGGSWSTPAKIVMANLPALQCNYCAGWPSLGIATNDSIYFSTTYPDSASSDTGAYLPFNVHYAEIFPYTGAISYGGKVSGIPWADTLNAIYSHTAYCVPLPGEVPTGQEGPGIAWTQMVNANPPSDIYYCHKDVLPPPGKKDKNTKIEIGNLKLTAQPNPFTKNVEIRLQIPEITKIENRNFPISQFPISLCIYDVSARLVKSFSPFALHSSPISSVTWDGRDDAGHRVKSGVYFVKLKVKSEKLKLNGKEISKKIILLE